MTDREKCFVINGLRSYILMMAEMAGEDVKRADAECHELVRRMGLDGKMLELTRQEAQAFLTLVMGSTHPYHARGN